MSDANQYKLAAKGGSLFGRQKLYFGEDHLLVIDGTYVERYRRLYYKDIQALLRYRTWSSIVIQLFLAMIIFFGVIGVFTGATAPNWWWLFLIVPISVILAYTFYAGRSCAVGVKTQVQLVRLTAIGGVRKARKFEQQLSERIEATQGALTSEALHAAQNTPQSAVI